MTNTMTEEAAMAYEAMAAEIAKPLIEKVTGHLNKGLITVSEFACEMAIISNEAYSTARRNML